VYAYKQAYNLSDTVGERESVVEICIASACHNPGVPKKWR